ncbi:peritrophin-1-like, partial [Haematobia irritans]|uniref:peritrophin-1-like n=1 Tax=Haematobia irritans TaxID=7368 RepID=UPI003F506D0A
FEKKNVILFYSTPYYNNIPPILTEPLGKSQATCPPGASGLYPHPSDCTKFLQCANGATYIQNCGPGTAFDSVHQVCDFKEKVHCGDVDSVNSGVLISGKSYEGHHESNSEFQSNSNHVECPAGVTGLYPHPHDCEKFLQCSNGQTYIQSCGPGTGFDSIRFVCDYQEKVQCGSGSSWGTTVFEQSRELYKFCFHFWRFNREL